MTKLDWDRLERERRVEKHGSAPTGITSFRAVAPSDKEVAQLALLGYQGARPATRAQLKHLMDDWHPQWVRLTGSDIREVRRLPIADRRLRASKLLANLDNAYKKELVRLGEAKVAARGKGKIEARMAHEFNCLSQLLRAMAL